MSVPKNPIFRDNAVKHYLQSREKDTLPRFVPLPIALFLWIVLGLLLGVGVVAWHEQIPFYVAGHGVVLSSDYVASSASKGGTMAVAFFAADQANNLHAGQKVFVSFASSAQSFAGTLLTISPVVSPAAAVQRYGLGNDEASLVTQPSVAAIIRLNTTSPSLYASSILTANVQVGSCSVLSLLPGIGGLLGK